MEWGFRCCLFVAGPFVCRCLTSITVLRFHFSPEGTLFAIIFYFPDFVSHRGRSGWQVRVSFGRQTDGNFSVQDQMLWQCDFFSKRIWTPTGLRQYFVLAFLHVGSRTVFVSKACWKPDAAWMKEQAEAFVEHVKSQGWKCEILNWSMFFTSHALNSMMSLISVPSDRCHCSCSHLQRLLFA